MAVTKPHLAQQNQSLRRMSRMVQSSQRADAEFAESHLQIIRLLLSYGKNDLARRRLQRVVDKYGNTPAGCESRKLLMTMEVAPPVRES
jgi:hypothetical protein